MCLYESDDKSFDDLAFEIVPDFDIYRILKEKHHKELEKRAIKLAQEKEEERFNAHKEEYQLEVLRQFQEKGIKKEGGDLSSASPLMTDTYTLNGVELFTDDFIPDSVVTDLLYEDSILVKNPYNLEYQEVNKKNGKRKLTWKESATLILIANPTAAGKCEDIAVYLKGRKRPLLFKNGDISEEEFRQQTTFARKGINVSVKKHYESFLRNLRECPNKKFLSIPKHAGGVMLPSGITTYISAESVIPGLEDLFPTEVKEHKLVVHELPFKDTVAIYRKALPNCLEAKLATTIRTICILQPLFGSEELHTDRGLSFSYTNESVKETIIALTKMKNYSSTVVQTLTAHITKVRKELASANDVTVLFIYSGIFEEGNKLKDAFKEVMWDITGENGTEDKTRKIVVFITDIPERIPDEYPAYYINCGDDIIPNNVSLLQRLSGMFDYSFKEYIYNNPDTARQLVRDGIKAARHIVSTFGNVVVTDTMIMTLATAHVLKRLGVVTGSDLRGIIRWFRTEATSKTTMTDAICYEFKTAVSNAILSGELKIAKQIGPPYYSPNAYTAFIAEKEYG